MSCFNFGGTTAVQFWVKGLFRSSQTLTHNQEIVAATIAGAVSGVPCCVMELTMIQQQRFGGSVLGTVRRVISEKGAQIMLRGISTTCGRESVCALGKQCCFE